MTEEERRDLRELQLLTAKPIMYVANVAENGFTNNPQLAAVEKRAAGEGAVVVPVCAAIEAEISQLDEADRADFLAELGLKEPGLDRVIRAAYQLLGLQTFFTAGPKEVRAWTVRAGATAPQAAGVIHTDFERGFIRAEVIAFADYLAGKGEAGAKEAGKLRLEGKEYVVQRRRRHALPLQRLSRAFEPARVIGASRRARAHCPCYHGWCDHSCASIVSCADCSYFDTCIERRHG